MKTNLREGSTRYRCFIRPKGSVLLWAQTRLYFHSFFQLFWFCNFIFCTVFNKTFLVGNPVSFALDCLVPHN